MKQLQHIDYEDHKVEEWRILIDTLRSDEPAEIHESVYWYFLEVLPPLALGSSQVFSLLKQEDNHKVLGTINSIISPYGFYIFKEGWDIGHVFCQNPKRSFFVGNTIKKYQ